MVPVELLALESGHRVHIYHVCDDALARVYDGVRIVACRPPPAG
jgi:hypothetical protein